MSFDLGSAIQGAVTAAAFGAPIWAVAAAFFVSGTAGGDAKRSARNKARSAFNDAQQDRMQMIQSATAPMKIVYGRARVSGPIAYAQSTGAKGEVMHLVVCLAGHECDAVETVYFNDTAVTLDGSGNVTNSEFSRVTVADWVEDVPMVAGASTVVTLSRTPVTKLLAVHRVVDGSTQAIHTATLAGNVVTIDNTGASVGDTYTISYQYQTAQTFLAQVKAYLGTTTQTADAGLIAASGGKWTSAHRLRGICYLYARLEFDQDVWGTVGLPEISAVVRGRKVWDPRTSTTVWRDNSALCAADYLRTVMGATSAEVPDAELAVEANACDEAVTIATGVTEARYTCNGVLSTDDLPRDNLDAIVETMAGQVVWVQGRFLIQAGRHLSPDFTLTEDWIADGAIIIRPDAARTELINRVVPSYVEPAKAYTTIEAPPVTNATYVAADGGLDLPTTLQLDLVTGAMRAQRLGKIELERNRQGLEVELPCNLLAYDAAPGRVVAANLGRYGWSGKLFVVTSRRYDLVSQTFRLRLRETAAGVWDWAFGAATTVDLTPNTSLPNAWAKPAALAGMGAASGTPWLQKLADGTVQCRASITWTQAGEMGVVRGGRVEVRWRRADSLSWQQGAPVAGDATSALIGPLEEKRTIIVGIRAVSMYGQAGPWVYVSHLPIGKSQPPVNVGGLAAAVVQGGILLSWNANGEADYAWTELRRGASWAAGTALDGSSVATKPTRVIGSGTLWVWPATGSYTIWAAHVDSSGNVSAAPASLAVTVDSAMSIVWSGITGSGKPADNATAGLFLNTDPFFLDPTRWTQSAANAYTFQTITDGVVGTRSLRSTLGGAGAFILAGDTPVDANKVYRVRAWVRKSAGANGTFFLAASIRDSSGVVIGGDGVLWFYPVAGAAPNTAWTEYVGIFGRGQTRTIPAAARTVSCGLFLGYTGTTTGYHEAQGLRLEDITEAYDASLTSTWSGVTGSGKPADNATVGATFGVNISGQAATTDIADAAVNTVKISANAATLVVTDETTFLSSGYTTGSPNIFAGFMTLTNPTTETLKLNLTGSVWFSWAGPAGVNSSNAGNTLNADLYVNNVFHSVIARSETVTKTIFPQEYVFPFTRELTVAPGATIRLDTVLGGSTATGSRTIGSRMRAELIKR